MEEERITFSRIYVYAHSFLLREHITLSRTNKDIHNVHLTISRTSLSEISLLPLLVSHIRCIIALMRIYENISHVCVCAHLLSQFAFYGCP